MAQINYDPFEGYKRLANAVDQMDARAAEIFAYHSALEVEMDLVLDALLHNGARIRRIGFANKVKVLHAAWIGDAEAGDKVCDAFSRFNDLRNAIAHHDQPAIDGCLIALRAAYRRIDEKAGDDAPIGEIAQGICAFIGDGPTPQEVAEVAAALEGLVGRFSKAFANVKFEVPAFEMPVIKVPEIDTSKFRFIDPKPGPKK